MNLNALTTTITAGVLTLSLIGGIVAMSIAAVVVPQVFYDLLPIGFTAAIVGAARTDAKSN